MLDEKEFELRLKKFSALGVNFVHLSCKIFSLHSLIEDFYGAKYFIGK